MAIVVFTYDFPHGKTQQMILDLLGAGLSISAVIGAPRQELPRHAEHLGYHPLPGPDALHPARLCALLGLPYRVIPHDQTERIAAARGPARLAVIGGARILRQPVIELFPAGVVNHHPGRIPDTSGLDSFYWMLEKNVPPAVTTHLIDEKVDQGWLLFESRVPLTPEDTPASVVHRIQQTLYQANRRLAERLHRGPLADTVPLVRPAKNPPMDDSGRARALARFPHWLAEQLAKQLAEQRAEQQARQTPGV